jgi:hypothetical protein
LTAKRVFQTGVVLRAPCQRHPTGETVEETDDYVHVRFRDPDDFETIRTPDRAENAASDVAESQAEEIVES